MMSNVVYKYPLAYKEEVELFMPRCSEILHCGPDPQGQLSLWVLVDPLQPPTAVTIQRLATGQEVADYPGKYLGIYHNGMFIWHLFLRPTDQVTVRR